MWKPMTTEKIHSFAHFVHTLIRSGDDNLKILKENLSEDVLSSEDCTQVLHHQINDKAALYIACEEGQLDIIRYLIVDCNVDVEQRGHYVHQHFQDKVPPLWSSTEKNLIEVVRLLILLGANVNCTSSTNGTAMLVGCLHNSEDCVRELVKAGANVNIANVYGATPLLNAASKGSLCLCEFLINNGADVHSRDCNGRTTLHRAIEENRLEIVKLLVEKGCDCKLKNDTGDNCAGDSALRLAALKGCNEIAEYLAKNVLLDNVDIVETYDLLGAFYAEKDEYDTATKYWLIALGLRSVGNEILTPKKMCKSSEQYTDYKEVSSPSEIAAISGKEEFMMQSLLMRERILGPLHSETVWSLDYCGAIYADRNNYDRCIRLWKCAYRRLSQQEYNFSDDCTFRIQAIMKVFLDLVQDNSHSKFPSNDLLDVYEILLSSMHFGSQMFSVRPRTENSAKRISIMMKMALQLMNLLLRKELEILEHDRLTNITERVVKTCIKDEEEKSLLHLSMDQATSVTNEYTYSSFPSFEVLKLLVDAGADVNSMDNNRNTALHYCVKPSMHKAAKYLLDNGAHTDLRNVSRESALDRLITSGFRVCPVEYCTLKCLAATVIAENNIIYEDYLPKSLYGFVDLHRPG